VAIDFHDRANRATYSGRDADESWRKAVLGLVDPASADVVDIGCGGGTYSRAWHDLGAATVTGVDFSGPILEAAREAHGELPGVGFRSGEATASGLPDASADIVFERALIHHVPDLVAVASEPACCGRTASSSSRTGPPRTSHSRDRPPIRGGGCSTSSPDCSRSRTVAVGPFPRCRMP
jgi:SAM-dependent methyltransferase